MSELLPQEVLGHLGEAQAIFIEVINAKGSTPRELGTWMVVTEKEFFNTIGGGHLEFEAIAIARSMLLSPPKQSRDSIEKTFPLGPALGQCCGGSVTLGFKHLANGKERADFFQALSEAAVSNLTRIAIFGGGHVAHAIVRALLPLPFNVLWIDSRENIFPHIESPKVITEHFDDVTAAVPKLLADSLILVMSFTHAEDLEVVRYALERKKSDPGCFPWIGLIGSQTKWARFRHRLTERGFSEAALSQVTCPIGIPGVAGKSPYIIAASVAAQLLAVRQTI